MLEIINLILSSIIQLISCTYIAEQLSQKRINYKKQKNILIFIIMSIVLVLLWKYSYNMYKPIMIYIILVVGYKYLLGITYQQSWIINFISVLLHAISELIITGTVISVIKLSPEFCEKYLIGTPILGLIALIIVIIITSILKKWLLKIVNLLEKELIFNIVYGTGIVGISLFLSLNIGNWENNSSFIINTVTILLFLILIIFLLSEKIKINKTTKKFDELFEQSESVKTLLNRYKKYNHENKNQLIIIRENSKGNDKVIEYIDSILNENVGHEDKWISELSYITDAGISGFLSVKINQMVDNGINVSLTISSKVKNFNFKNIKAKEYKEICRVIGVYLDNAYEASKETEKKEVTIELLLDEKKLLLIISNSYIGKIELDKMDNEGYTTKGTEHGAGLSMVKDIISSNKNLEQKREIIKDYYYQYLYIVN